MHFFRLSAVFLCLLTGQWFLAQEQVEIEIPPLSRAPELADFAGMEPATDLAKTMAVVSGFTQREPIDGAPATQKTTVYLGYDQKNFYAFFLAFDTEPEKIRAHMSPRERVFGDE